MSEVIQTPMAQGRSTKIISMIRWVRTSRFSIKKSLYERGTPVIVPNLPLCALPRENTGAPYFRVGLYRGTSLIRNRPTPRTTVGPLATAGS